MKQIKRWNDIANELQLPAEASESIERNNNDMKLNSTANTFSKIFQPKCNEQLNLTVPLAIVNSFPWSIFPLRANRET